MTTLPTIPVHDHREGGLAAYGQARLEGAHEVMETVLGGLGIGGRLLRPLLPLGDRIATRWLRRVGDPYLDEILALRRAMERPGAAAFSLSYEFGCTARAFDGPAPTLFRTLDWPFDGLGRLVEVVRLRGPAGDWVTATWPGVVGVLHGAAPGRFAASLNQAPERRSGLGRVVDWVTGRVRLMRGRGLPPAHLLRRVFETAPDFESARRALAETPVAAPVIFTLAGTAPGETLTIERTETGAEMPEAPLAANHFTTAEHPRNWRPRGFDSTGRIAQIAALEAPPPGHTLRPPMLNALTRLAVTADAAGRFGVTGYDAEGPVTRTLWLG